jgi:hypothetical protein
VVSLSQARWGLAPGPNPYAGQAIFIEQALNPLLRDAKIEERDEAVAFYQDVDASELALEPVKR